jgi:hypothetical protein
MNDIDCGQLHFAYANRVAITIKASTAQFLLVVRQTRHKRYPEYLQETTVWFSLKKGKFIIEENASRRRFFS